MGILAVILSILAVLCALLATLLFGTMGGIIAAVVAIVAIVLAVFQRMKTKKGGIPAIVIGVIAIILAFSMTNTMTTLFKTLHDKAVEYKPDSLWAQVSEDYNNGMMGIIKNLPKDEASLNILIEEMNELNSYVEKK